MKKRELEFDQRLFWFFNQFGQDRVKDVRFEVHASRKEFDKYMTEVGHPQLCGGDNIEVLCPVARIPVHVKCYEECEWEVFTLPTREQWTPAEKIKWIALNN